MTASHGVEASAGPARCPVQADFDPLAPDFLADPFTVLADLPTDTAPVFYAPSIDHWVITGYADIAEIFAHPETYSAAAAQLPLVRLEPEAERILLDGGHSPQPSMASIDPPDHARLRRPTARALSGTRVRKMAPTIQTRVEDLLDAVGDARTFDLVEVLCFPLPADTIFSLIGVPLQNYPRLRSWCRSRTALQWGRPTPSEQVDIATNLVNYRHYLRALVHEKQVIPGDDLTSDLVEIHHETPEALTVEEIASILFSLSFAGQETTNYLIGNTMRRLLEDPARWERVVADPSLIPGAVEETLRFDPSVPVWRRMTTRPVTVAGVDLPAGAKLFLWLAAAGRDPHAFDDPDTFVLDRPDAKRHLAFGGRSIHLCLGANLARLEARIAIELLALRYPRLSLPDQHIPFHPNISNRGPGRLLVAVG